MRVVHRQVAALLVVAGFVAVGCAGPSGTSGAGTEEPPSSAAGTAPSSGSASPGAGGTAAGDPLGTFSKYADAVDAAHRQGLAVWLEADLVTRWLQGPESLAAGVDRVAELATRPGVVGVKIADELGETDGLDSRQQVLAFLEDASHALRAALPAATQLLVDVVVPELGCMPGEPSLAIENKECAADVRARWPGATLDVVDAVVRSGLLDAVDVSTGLRDPAQYEAWGTTREEAQRAAWKEIARRGWADHAFVAARKAMAFPAPFGTPVEAAAAVPTFVDLPVAGGARAVDIWTWRQQYDGATVGLMEQGLQRNALWDALLRRRARGVQLFTHFTPSQLQRGLDADLAAIATVFSGVFVAAGTG
jgi:hypothetical protein